MASVWGELKRRNVVKVAVAYAIVGWILVEVSSVLGPALSLPDWATSFVAFLLILGFPIAMLLTWAYELTPEGMKKTKTVPLSESITKVTGRKLDFVIIGVLAIAVAFFAVDRFVLDTSGPFAGADIDPASLDVVLDEPPSTAAELTPAIAEEAQREVLPNSVAVLPFRNDSPDPDNAYYASGIHEEILNHLVKLSALSVIARTSVEQYRNTEKSIPEIARELNVETVMEGSLRYDSGRIRITVQLNDGITGAHLWSETYTRDFDDIFAIESDVAMNVANAVGAEFSLEEQASIEKLPTNSPEAYDLYVKAGQIGGDVGLAYLDQAIELDPNFAEAYARRAGAKLIRLQNDLRPGETIADRLDQEVPIRRDLERALALDPGVGQAYAELAYLHERNWRGAEAQEVYERALQLLPNDVTLMRNFARFKAWTEQQPEEAISLATRATELAPNSGAAYRNLGNVHDLLGNRDEAYSAFYKALSISSPGRVAFQIAFAHGEVSRGNSAEAQSALRLVEPLALDSDNIVFLATVAYLYSKLGMRDDVARVLVEFDERAADRTIASSSRVLVNLARGDEERALQWLTTAAEDREVYLGQNFIMRIKFNVWEDPVLDRPEFVKLREQLGFTDL